MLICIFTFDGPIVIVVFLTDTELTHDVRSRTVCVYILRVNLSIAIVAMTQNKTHVVNGTEISVSVELSTMCSLYVTQTLQLTLKPS